MYNATLENSRSRRYPEVDDMEIKPLSSRSLQIIGIILLKFGSDFKT